jgi:hypothetical protein
MGKDPVVVYSSSSYARWPTALYWDDRRLPVRRLIAEWRTPRARNFLVQTDGERQFECSFDEDQNRWRVTER